MGDWGYVIGQALGVAAMILGVVAFQLKQAKGILALKTVMGGIFITHYALIGSLTGAALNTVVVISYLFYAIRNKRGSKGSVLPLIFTALVVLVGSLTWEGWHSGLSILGLAVNSIAMAIPDAQKIRYAMLIKSPCCMTYNIVAGSIGGLAYECASLLSVVIGIVRHCLEKKRGAEHGEV